jgi:copper chaperone CopZ
MTCITCEIPIESNLKKLPGVQSARASAAKGAVTIHYDPLKITVQQMIETINSTGYRAQIPQS